jgi:hypothetical protein
VLLYLDKEDEDYCYVCGADSMLCNAIRIRGMQLLPVLSLGN